MHTGMERGMRRFSARPKDTLRRVFHIPVRKRKNGNERSKGRRRVHPFDIEPVARKLAARTTRRFIGNDPTCETLLRRCFSRIEKLVNYIPPTTPFFGVASRSRNREANPAKNESRVTWKIHGTKR